MAMLDTSPSFHFAGTFGHEGSTSNNGKEVCAAASVPNGNGLTTLATMTNAIRTARRKFLRFMAYLLVQCLTLLVPYPVYDHARVWRGRNSEYLPQRRQGRKDLRMRITINNFF